LLIRSKLPAKATAGSELKKDGRKQSSTLKSNARILAVVMR
jgi:hypothetical protein